MPSAMSALPQPLEVVLPHLRKRCPPRLTPGPQVSLPQPGHGLGCPVKVAVIESELVGSGAARWLAPYLIRQRPAAAFATSRLGSSRPPSRWIQR